jgi:hypothetical protein
VAFLGDVGGRTLEEIVRRIMPRIMVNDLSLQFNMDGLRGKFGFAKSNLFDVVFSEYRDHFNVLSMI